MENNADFNTETMARIFADQGHFDRAAGIYRLLLEADPGRSDLANALAAVEAQAAAGTAKSPADLEPLMAAWIDLLLTYRNILKLKDLKRRREAVPVTAD